MSDTPVTPPGWEGILDPGEVILWQGAPAPGLRWEFKTAFEPIFMVFWTGFSVFWMLMASRGGGFFWAFGLLFFGIGLYQLVGQHFFKAYIRRHTFYTLSDRRAFIATDAFGKRTLDSYPITKSSPLSLIERGRASDVHFAKRTVRSNKQYVEEGFGFAHVTNGAELLSMLRDIQYAQSMLADDDAALPREDH